MRPTWLSQAHSTRSKPRLLSLGPGASYLRTRLLFIVHFLPKLGYSLVPQTPLPLHFPRPAIAVPASAPPMPPAYSPSDRAAAPWSASSGPMPPSALNPTRLAPPVSRSGGRAASAGRSAPQPTPLLTPRTMSAVRLARPTAVGREGAGRGEWGRPHHPSQRRTAGGFQVSWRARCPPQCPYAAALRCF